MVKEKPNSTRMYDQDGYRRRAACICVRNEAENENIPCLSCKNDDRKHRTEVFVMVVTQELDEWEDSRSK
ncbi:diphosphoinositol polyphosphate phosphohydrolase 2-like [Diaphorina citri]|uniref:Diphosphoinositol polyphosphate phosphohydrolase 2-like n=1 Tax=Diaphorina citri TaxID=121845 RepID=A0A3Q0IUQ5_DIACI|nr:diphosphoinositol polyphosphate phosphohydrolase 2-like [Diaphorina citri]